VSDGLMPDMRLPDSVLSNAEFKHLGDEQVSPAARSIFRATD
jgi:hypothetical protein